MAVHEEPEDIVINGVRVFRILLGCEDVAEGDGRESRDEIELKDGGVVEARRRLADQCRNIGVARAAQVQSGVICLVRAEDILDAAAAEHDPAVVADDSDQSAEGARGRAVRTLGRPGADVRGQLRVGERLDARALDPVRQRERLGGTGAGHVHHGLGRDRHRQGDADQPGDDRTQDGYAEAATTRPGSGDEREQRARGRAWQGRGGSGGHAEGAQGALVRLENREAR